MPGLFVVSGQFWPYIYCRKPRNRLCFDSEVDLRSFKLGNRAFSSNPGARALNAWSVLLKTLMGHFSLVRILQALSARAPGFEENVRLPKF